MNRLELKVPPVLVTILFAAAMFGAARLLPGLSFALPAKAALALAVAVLGVALAIAGVAAFRAERTTVDPRTPGASTSVVSGGVYRLTRNPMYLGMLAALAGWALWLANAAAIVLAAAFPFYLTRFQIVPEERALLAKFGPAYARYLQRVRRWV